MNKLKHYVLPEHTNTLYKEEAASSIALTREIADKINEIVDAFNEISEGDLAWKQTQEGIIRKGVLYMKDNLINALFDLLKVYDYETIKRMMMEAYGKDLRIFVTPQMFGAVGDGVTNDTAAIEKAIASLSPGDVLYFPKGTYRMTGKPVEITKERITFEGEGKILCDYGFRIKGSHFKAQGLHMECVSYGQDHRAFMIDNKIDNGVIPAVVEDLTFKDCYFKNFFYSVCCVGGSYNYDGTEEEGTFIRDLVIENCHSVTYSDQNAGHFQCIQVANIAYINNRTYGGKNASSYNAIKGNGYIRVIGNYDHNNSYASCEIENGSGRAVIANNTFNSKIWVDDVFDCVISGNVTTEGITVTVGSDVVFSSENVIISNNICKNIRCEQFGTYVGGVIRYVNITSNTVNGDQTHGIWIHGAAVQKALVANNMITGTNATNDIAVVRNAQLECYIKGNFGNGKALALSGTDGKVFVIDNYNMTSSGTRDALPASKLERTFNALRIADSSEKVWEVSVSTSGTLEVK